MFNKNKFPTLAAVLAATELAIVKIIKPVAPAGWLVEVQDGRYEGADNILNPQALQVKQFTPKPGDFLEVELERDAEDILVIKSAKPLPKK